jgi:hypothetical protein
MLYTLPMQLSAGVIIFQVQRDTPFGDAVLLDGGAAYNHCGLALGSDVVVEATRERGVVLTSLERFLAQGARSTGADIAAASLIGDACKRARSFVGAPYNATFAPDTPGFYCSQLITASFKNTDGSDYFPLQPLRFRGADGAILPYWLDYYKELDAPIPEGALGSHPDGLAHCTDLFARFYEL